MDFFRYLLDRIQTPSYWAYLGITMTVHAILMFLLDINYHSMESLVWYIPICLIYIIIEYEYFDKP